MITPHVAGNFHHASIYRDVMDLACENLANYLAGRPIGNLVDLSTGYRK